MTDNTQHLQSFRIVGFCDVPVKPAKDGVTLFAEEDRVELPHLPTEASLLEYATSIGTYPGTHPNMTHRPGMCQPVYEVLGDGTDYLKCKLCFENAGVLIVDGEMIREAWNR